MFELELTLHITLFYRLLQYTSELFFQHLVSCHEHCVTFK